MNYRHAYHAGNYCDVLKHMVLIALVSYLKRKEKPFRVIDTHGGIGLYDLSGEEAEKTGEWRDGVGRIAALNPAGLPTMVQAYRDHIIDDISKEKPSYPGSPKIVSDLLRAQDRLTAVELHPADVETLRHTLSRDKKAKVVELDGWLALKAFLPPKEKRGLVLIDPPYERRDDFQTMANGLGEAVRRWPSGVYALWYPLKDIDAVTDFKKRIQALQLKNALVAEICICDKGETAGLFGSGLVIINPPYTLEADLHDALPVVAKSLAQGKGATFHVEILAQT